MKPPGQSSLTDNTTHGMCQTKWNLSLHSIVHWVCYINNSYQLAAYHVVITHVFGLLCETTRCHYQICVYVYKFCKLLATVPWNLHKVLHIPGITVISRIAQILYICKIMFLLNLITMYLHFVITITKYYHHNQHPQPSSWLFCCVFVLG